MRSGTLKPVRCSAESSKLRLGCHVCLQPWLYKDMIWRPTII